MVLSVRQDIETSFKSVRKLSTDILGNSKKIFSFYVGHNEMYVTALSKGTGTSSVTSQVNIIMFAWLQSMTQCLLMSTCLHGFICVYGPATRWCGGYHCHLKVIKVVVQTPAGFFLWGGCMLLGSGWVDSGVCAFLKNVWINRNFEWLPFWASHSNTNLTVQVVWIVCYGVWVL